MYDEPHCEICQAAIHFSIVRSEREGINVSGMLYIFFDDKDVCDATCSFTPFVFFSELGIKTILEISDGFPRYGSCLCTYFSLTKE